MYPLSLENVIIRHQTTWTWGESVSPLDLLYRGPCRQQPQLGTWPLGLGLEADRCWCRSLEIHRFGPVPHLKGQNGFRAPSLHKTSDVCVFCGSTTCRCVVSINMNQRSQVDKRWAVLDRTLNLKERIKLRVRTHWAELQRVKKFRCSIFSQRLWS